MEDKDKKDEAGAFNAQTFVDRNLDAIPDDDFSALSAGERASVRAAEGAGQNRKEMIARLDALDAGGGDKGKSDGNGNKDIRGDTGGNARDLGEGAAPEEVHSAGVHTEKGPAGPHLEEDDLLDTTDGPIEIDTIQGQDVEAVEARTLEDTEGLEVNQADKTLRTGDGSVAYAEPGSLNAAQAGVQQDASGHFESTGHTRSAKSGVRV